VVEDDGLVGTMGADDGAAARRGWPNRFDDTGAIVAMAADESNNLYVTEWFHGGRISRADLAGIARGAPTSTAREV
jgi:hypothetical protein